MINYDPFDVILNNRFDEFKDRDPLRDAIAQLWKSIDRSKIVPILRSKNSAIVGYGLFMLSEAGPLPTDVIDLLLEHLDHKQWDSRFYLANCLLVSHENLMVSHLAAALRLASDENINVRCEMMQLIEVVSPTLLKEAVIFQEPNSKAEHEEGLRLLDREIKNEELVPILAGGSRIVSCYAGARLFRNALSGQFEFKTEDIIDDSEELKCVLRQFKRISRRK